MKDVETIAKKLLELQEFLYGLLKIDRMIYLPEHVLEDRAENDVEHSYNLAMLAWYVSDHMPGLDKDKVIRYALIHDLVEVHAGDVMAIGRTEAEQHKKEEREQEAVKKIKQTWQADFPDMTSSIESYEEQNDEEAIFVKALDKLSAMIHNIQGEGYTWKKWDMERGVIMKNKDVKTATSKEVSEIWQVFRELIMNHPEWFNPGRAN